MLLKCSTCQEMKEEQQFHRNKGFINRNGRTYECKSCCKKRTSSAESKMRSSIKFKEKYNANRDYYLNKAKKYAATPEGKQRKAASDKRYYEKNKERSHENSRRWAKNNPEKRKEIVKRWDDAHAMERYHRKKNTDMQFMLQYRIRARFSYWIRYNRGIKQHSVQDLVGMPIEEFKQWIESQFKEGMSWENRKEWHIDHYIPLCFFDMEVDEEVRMAWNYRNMKPTWVVDNLSKGYTLPKDYKAFVLHLRSIIRGNQCV